MKEKQSISIPVFSMQLYLQAISEKWCDSHSEQEEKTDYFFLLQAFVNLAVSCNNSDGNDGDKS